MIGDAAKNQLTTNPENTVFDAKRMIGREWSEKEVQHDIKYFPFKVIEKNTKPHIVLQTNEGEKTFAAEEISAMVLTKMKETAEAYLGKKVTHAVVTVPAVRSTKIMLISCNIFKLSSIFSISTMLNVKQPRMLALFLVLMS